MAFYGAQFKNRSYTQDTLSDTPEMLVCVSAVRFSYLRLISRDYSILFTCC